MLFFFSFYLFTFFYVAKQKDPPKIFVSISNNRITGDELIANCTTSISRPPPHISWMINGIQVINIYKDKKNV